MAARVRTKICGITCPEDARMCVEAGADAIGVNLIPSSKRCVGIEEATAITKAVAQKALVVLVVADLDAETMADLRRRVGAGCLQLHGDEPPDVLRSLLPHAYKAAKISGDDDVVRARAYPGQYLMVDAKVPFALGGTGTAFDWRLVTELAKERRLVLAGGLTPGNVAAAIGIVRPDCVDVASGVEATGNARRKDEALVRAFVDAARNAPG